jgi:predicted metal-dependent peptidase
MKNARIKLLLGRPFIGSMTMGIIYEPISIIDTACITGPELFYNPDWVAILNVRQAEGLWAHEVYHVGMCHHLRFDPLTMEVELWQLATDFAINDLLLKDGLVLPPGGCFGVPKFEGWAAERIYRFLLQQQKQSGQNMQDFIKDLMENGIPGEMPAPQISQPAPDQKGQQKATGKGASQKGKGASQKPGKTTNEKGPASSTGSKPTPQTREKNAKPDGQSGIDKGGKGKDPQKQDKSAGGHDVSDKKISPKMFDNLSKVRGVTGIGGVVEPLNDEGEQLSEPDKTAMEKQMQVKVMMNSEIGTTTWGSLPGFAKDVIKDVKGDAQRDYRDELRDIMVEVTKDDYSWSKPNRRYIAQGIYLPSIGSEEKGTLVLAFDSSGSVGRNEKKVYAAEVTGILEDFPQLKLYCIYADTGVRHTEEFDYGEGLPISLDFRGGGGTSFHDTFKHIEKEGLEPKLLMYFTDLCVNEGGYPKYEPDYPVIWMHTKKGLGLKKMRWGKILKLDPNLPRRT